MSKQAIVFYLHVHQPYRVRHYTIFDTSKDHNYFFGDAHERMSNQQIMHKVAEKSYIPTNKKLLELMHQYPDFRLSLSMSGTVLEQLEKWEPDALESFKKLAETGRVEFVGETFHHSLAFFYSRSEFDTQVRMHREKVQTIFGQTPKVFRNTELAYNNELAQWAEDAGYEAILAEGWDPILGWRSPNFVYRPSSADNIKLLVKNYKLSDDIAFRFGDQNWSEWPLTADKFVHWLNSVPDATNFNLFMDYETFGEHQWGESGIFNFLHHLPEHWLKDHQHSFMTVSEAAGHFEPKDRLDMPHTVTWADTERDLSAWLGNSMQQTAIQGIYDLEDKIIGTNDLALIEDWRRLQTSDHFYYMCTKWFNDGDIHAYFNPYETPYEAYITFMNAWHDIKYRLIEKGVEV